MKTKITKKLNLNKRTVASLEDVYMMNVKGGADTLVSDCQSFCAEMCTTYEYTGCDCFGFG